MVHRPRSSRRSFRQQPTGCYGDRLAVPILRHMCCVDWSKSRTGASHEGVGGYPPAPSGGSPYLGEMNRLPSSCEEDRELPHQR